MIVKLGLIRLANLPAGKSTITYIHISMFTIYFLLLKSAKTLNVGVHEQQHRLCDDADLHINLAH